MSTKPAYLLSFALLLAASTASAEIFGGIGIGTAQMYPDTARVRMMGDGAYRQKIYGRAIDGQDLSLSFGAGAYGEFWYGNWEIGGEVPDEVTYSQQGFSIDLYPYAALRKGQRLRGSLGLGLTLGPTSRSWEDPGALSKVTYDAFLIGWMFQPEVEARISRFVTTGMLRFRGRKADAERKSFMRASPGAPMQETDLWPQEFVSRELALQLTAGAVLGGLLAMEVGGRAEWTGNTTNTEPNWSGQADFWEMMVLLRVRLVDGWE